MVITSLGIFGFLSKAHLEHSIATGGTNELQISNLERQIARQQSIIVDSETVLSQLDAQVQTLIDYDRIRGPSGSIATRQAQAEERQTLNENIDAAYNRIEELQTILAPIQQEKLSIEVEVGPLKYIAELIYGQEGAEDYFDEAVRAVIILLIITFDPLAVVLLLAATQGFTQRKKERMAMFDPNNVADIEDNLTDFEDWKDQPLHEWFDDKPDGWPDRDQPEFEDAPIPTDDDLETYEVVKDYDEKYYDPTDPVRRGRRDR